MEKKSLILCDTNVIIEFYKENPAIVKNLESIGQENIAISIITAGELLYGALNKRELERIQKDIDHLELLKSCLRRTILVNTFLIDFLQIHSSFLYFPPRLMSTRLINNYHLNHHPHGWKENGARVQGEWSQSVESIIPT